MKARLGLGLTHQCLTIAGLANRWPDAHEEFAEVLRLYAAAPPAGDRGRQVLLLAAEARAGQALISFLTANGPQQARYGGLRSAVERYEEALRMLDRIDVVRRTYLERELVYLHNLRSVRQAMRQPARVAEVNARIAAARDRLAQITE
jgi:hypothetical protein